MLGIPLKSTGAGLRGWHHRFWSHVNKTSDCWEWTAAVFKVRGKQDSQCYGAFGRRVLTSMPFYETGETAAHRISWVLHFGAIPQGAFILHNCDNPRCVNPQHLSLGDSGSNADGRRNRGRYTYNLIPSSPRLAGYFQHD